MRNFKSGATRDDSDGKYDFEGFLSCLVLERYAEYMNKHRKQADGKLRDSDNWQKGFGDNHYDVCMKSLWRHFIDMWSLHRKLIKVDKKDGHKITMEEAICAILFNCMAYLHKLLTETKNVNKS